MSSVNKVMLIGRLGANPELRHTNGGTAVCQLSLATNRQWKDDSGQRQEEVDWHRVVVWGKQAEICHQYLSKGRQVFIEGRLHSRSYMDATGNKRFATEVVSNTVLFLANRARAQAEGAESAAAESEPQLSELPF